MKKIKEWKWWKENSVDIEKKADSMEEIEIEKADKRKVHWDLNPCKSLIEYRQNKMGPWSEVTCSYCRGRYERSLERRQLLLDGHNFFSFNMNKLSSLARDKVMSYLRLRGSKAVKSNVENNGSSQTEWFLFEDMTISELHYVINLMEKEKLKIRLQMYNTVDMLEGLP